VLLRSSLVIAAVAVPLTLTGTAAAAKPRVTRTASAGKPVNNAMSYHGGPVMLGTPNVYYIWYGNWPTGNPVQPILDDFAGNLGGSPYFNINTTYYMGGGGGTRRFVFNALAFAGETTDNYSRGTSLNDAAVQAIVSQAITSGALPSDSNGVYVVLASADVNETSGLDTQYCAFHTHSTIGGVDVKYAFVGDPTRAPSACEQQSVGPNGSSGADGMASLIAHELDESVNDPDLNAWYTGTAQESADLCAWTFGTTYISADGAMANMNLGGRDWLIQQNWVNVKKGYCALQFP
jgi:hypothetical protein